MTWPFAPPIETMEARTSEVWPAPKGSGFAYEPKWDGFRSVTWSGDEPRIDSRNQRPLLRYFPELRPAIARLPAGTVVDGEIVVVVDDVTSFDSIQLRLHPAESRVALLSGEIPAQLVAFDLLALAGEDLRGLPFSERRSRLEHLFDGLEHPWNLTPSTTDEATARAWFDEFESAGCDGIVVKSLDAAYAHGKRAMVKIKHRRTVDCVVPKRMVLAPLQRQTVRLLARPPQGLPDGEYWSRIIISAKEGSEPVALADTSGIKIGLSLEVRTIIPLTYRKGALTTGLQMSGLHSVAANDSLHLRAHLVREGRAAYIGTARGTLVDSAGKKVAAFEEPIAVYYEVDPVFAFPTVGLPPGRYRARIELVSERPDITPDLLLRAKPVRDSLEVRLP